MLIATVRATIAGWVDIANTPTIIIAVIKAESGKCMVFFLVALSINSRETATANAIKRFNQIAEKGTNARENPIRMKSCASR